MAQSTAWHCNFLAPKLREIAGPAQRPLSLHPLVAKDLHRVFVVVFCVFATPMQWGTAGLLSHCSRHLPGQPWPEMKILASRTGDENTKPSLPPVSYRSVIGKAKDIWRRKGKALSVKAVPIFLFPWHTAAHSYVSSVSRLRSALLAALCPPQQCKDTPESAQSCSPHWLCSRPECSQASARDTQMCPSYSTFPGTPRLVPDSRDRVPFFHIQLIYINQHWLFFSSA